MKKLKKYGALIVAILSMAGCGGSNESSPAPGPEKSALSKDTLENVARVLWMPEYDEQKTPVEIRENLSNLKNSPETVGKNTKTFIRQASGECFLKATANGILKWQKKLA